VPVYYSSIWLSVYLATWLSDHLTIYLFSFFIYLFIDLRIWLSIHLTIYLAISVYLAIDRSIYLFIELSLKLSISVAICLMQGSMWQHWSCLSPSSKNPRLVPLDEIQSLYPFFFKSRSHVFTLCPNFIPADVCNWHYCWAMNYIQVPLYFFVSTWPQTLDFSQGPSLKIQRCSYLKALDWIHRVHGLSNIWWNVRPWKFIHQACGIPKTH